MDGRVLDGATSCLASSYPSIYWEREELVRDMCAIEVPQTAASGRCGLYLRLQAMGSSGRWETVRVWSSAGWEESFALGAVEVVGP